MIGRRYFVQCDACGKRAAHDCWSSQEARRIVRKLGWLRVPGSARSGMDFCPSCRPIVEAKP